MLICVIYVLIYKAVLAQSLHDGSAFFRNQIQWYWCFYRSRNECVCEGDTRNINVPLADMLFPQVSAQELQSAFKVSELEGIKQRRRMEYKKFLKRCAAKQPKQSVIACDFHQSWWGVVHFLSGWLSSPFLLKWLVWSYHFRNGTYWQKGLVDTYIIFVPLK